MSKNDHVHTFYQLTPSKPLFKNLEILRVDDVFKFHVSKFIYSCINGSTPKNFENWFTLNHTVHNYNTVSNTIINMSNLFEIVNVEKTNNLHNVGGRLDNYGAKLLKVLGPKIWNNIPLEIRKSKNIFLFKLHLKRHFINEYA